MKKMAERNSGDPALFTLKSEYARGRTKTSITAATAINNLRVALEKVGDRVRGRKPRESYAPRTRSRAGNDAPQDLTAELDDGTRIDVVQLIQELAEVVMDIHSAPSAARRTPGPGASTGGDAGEARPPQAAPPPQLNYGGDSYAGGLFRNGGGMPDNGGFMRPHSGFMGGHMGDSAHGGRMGGHMGGHSAYGGHMGESAHGGHNVNNAFGHGGFKPSHGGGHTPLAYGGYVEPNDVEPDVEPDSVSGGQNKVIHIGGF